MLAPLGGAPTWSTVKLKKTSVGYCVLLLKRNVITLELKDIEINTLV